MFVYLPFAAAGLILPVEPALRLPPAGPSFGVPPNDWPGNASAASCAAIRSDPRCWLCPFKRPAGVQWPTATSNPKPPVAAHGRSWMRARPLDQNPVGNSCSRGTAALHLQSVPENPPFLLGFLGAYAPKRLFGYFLCAQKVTAGSGAAQAPSDSRHSAFRRTTAQATQAPPWKSRPPLSNNQKQRLI